MFDVCDCTTRTVTPGESGAPAQRDGRPCNRPLRDADARGRGLRRLAGEAGSVATEYGLLAVVAATIVAIVLEWATSGGISGLLDRVLARVSTLVGL